MFAPVISIVKCLCSATNSSRIIRTVVSVREYADDSCKRNPAVCTRAHADIPDPVDPECEIECKTKMAKQPPGIVKKIALKVMEGGSNFGTPFKWLNCAWATAKQKYEPKPEPPALPEPKPTIIAMPDTRPGVQVTILGADTQVGQYISLLLKQCPQVKRLRLYEAKDPCSNADMSRGLDDVVKDLKNIDTSCRVQYYSCRDCGLNLSLQSTDIVLILENGYANVDMPIEKRFNYQAPIIKEYADVIARECPKAFIIVCASPIDCMVPLIAETLQETGWYDPRKLLGSVAVQEMRASTLAARALSLDPRITHVPCVGGTEGDALVPLFSKAIDHFDFPRQSSEIMTKTVRCAPKAVARFESQAMRAADLSEAFAVSNLVSSVARGLLCVNVPKVSGFVATDSNQVISPARFIANPVEVDGRGICKYIGLPKMNEIETTYLNLALMDLSNRLRMAQEWQRIYNSSGPRLNDKTETQFFKPRDYPQFDDCAYGNVF